MRQRLGLKQSDFAERFGISLRTLKRYEQEGQPTGRIDSSIIAALEAAEAVADEEQTPPVAVDRASAVVREKIVAALYDLPIGELNAVLAQVKRAQVRALTAQYRDVAMEALGLSEPAATGDPQVEEVRDAADDAADAAARALEPRKPDELPRATHKGGRRVVG